MNLVGRFPAFASPDYRRLWLSGFLTTAAMWSTFLARGWLTFELTGSATAVGAVTFVAWMPFVVLGPVAGVLADRLDRRLQLLVAMAGMVAAAALLAAVELAGAATLWPLLGTALLGGCAQAFALPPQQALIANVVPAENLLNAVALSSIGNHGSRIVGPFLGAPLLVTVGPGAIFAAATLLLVWAFAVAWRLHPQRAGLPASHGGGLRGIVDDLTGAVRHIESDRRLATIIVLVSLHCGLTMAFDSMMPTLATMVGGADRTYSAILVGMGVGAIAGTLWLAMIGEGRVQGSAYAVSGVGSGLAMVLLGLATSPLLVTLAAMVTGATQFMFMALTTTQIQQLVPDVVRGRVMSLYWGLSTAHMAFLNFGFGWAADGVGVRLLLIIPGLLWTTIFVIAVLRLADVRVLVSRGAPEIAIAPQV
ncbi:MAG: MFS transporter [Chloroflexi bacterium]|nr:MFS transporter [Chloroflexota bacterium]